VARQIKYIPYIRIRCIQTISDTITTDDLNSSSEVKIAFIIARKEIMVIFVWNSQGAVFYAHQSEKL